LFVDLFGYDPDRCLEPGQALEGFLRALGVPGEQIPCTCRTGPGCIPQCWPPSRRRGRQVLVVADNASTAKQAQPLLPADGNCAAIVTSRDTLAMLGARLLDLNVLAVPDAVRLLEQALRVANPADARVTTAPDQAATIDLAG
jgi:hypothetical protein